MKKGIFYTVSAAAIGGVCLFGAAHHHVKSIFHSENHNKKIDFIVKHMGRKLELSEIQRDEIKALLKKSHNRIGGFKEEHKKLKNEFKSDFVSSDFDAGKYSTKFKEHVLNNDSDIFTETVNGVHGILNEDQRTKLIFLMDKHRNHHHHHFFHKG